MTIYLLTVGDYSDYHVIGCFSTKELAIKAKEKYRYSDIEEYELDEIGKDDRFPYHVMISDYDTRAFAWSDMNEINKVYSNKDRSDCFVTVLAEDEKHAIKIASDLIAQYKATK